MSAMTLLDSEILDRRPLGVRLRLADYGGRASNSSNGCPARLIGETPRALRLFPLSIGGTPEKARPCARARSRRRLPRHRVSASRKKNRGRYRRLLAARREQVTSVLPRGEALGVAGENEARQRVSAAGLRGRSRPCAICRKGCQWPNQLRPRAGRATAQSGVNRDYVLATVKAIEAEGFSRYAIAPIGADAARFAPGPRTGRDEGGLFNLHETANGIGVCGISARPASIAPKKKPGDVKLAFWARCGAVPMGSTSHRFRRFSSKANSGVNESRRAQGVSYVRDGKFAGWQFRGSPISATYRFRWATPSPSRG